MFDYTPRIGCSAVPPPPPPPPPKKGDGKDKGKPSAVPAPAAAAVAAAAPAPAAPLNPFARASSPASLAFAPSRDAGAAAEEQEAESVGSDAPPPPSVLGAITWFGDEEVRHPLSSKTFAKIMHETVGGAGRGPGAGWSKWWRVSQEAEWLSMMPPVVKMVYNKKIDLAPDETLMPLWKVIESLYTERCQY